MMTDYEILAIYCFGYVLGTAFGYIKWAPMTPFKRGFLSGITFGLWRGQP